MVVGYYITIVFVYNYFFLYQDYNQPKHMCTYNVIGTCDC